MTLTGPGGVGKTPGRARRRSRDADDHARWRDVVDLAGVARAEDVAPAVAQVFGVTRSPSESVSEAPRRHLAGKRMLLVIDNFEHVLDAAVLVADLRAASPGLSVLATAPRGA